MSAFSVETSEITKRVAELRGKKESLAQQITTMKTKKDELNSTWDGPAKKNFSTVVENDALQMENFCKLVENYCIALENISNQYIVTEANNANTVAKRTY